MKSSLAIHKLAACLVFLAWVGAMVAMMVNWSFWSGALPFILFASMAAIIGAVLLSRYLIRRGRSPSYGTILGVPFVCAFLLVFGTLLWDACFDDGWQVFTLSYWQQTKGGLADMNLAFLLLWFVCLFPTTAIVIYFQKPLKSESNS